MSFTNFGRFIYEYRTTSEKSISPLMVSQGVGCSASFIRGIERGIQFASSDMAIKILKYYEIEYVRRDLFTLEVNGSIFEFKSSSAGRNTSPSAKHCRTCRCLEQDSWQTNIEARVSALENRMKE